MAEEKVWRPWREAWQQALYGPDGFYRRDEGPAGHFRTAAHASAGGALARALAELARRAGCTRVVDVGAGRGELLAALHAVAPDLALHGVDVVARPQGLPPRIGWSCDLVGEGGLRNVSDTAVATLLVGWELLDVVPCTVLEADRHGVLRTVEVHPDGRERLGVEPDEADLAWCRAWWPGPYAPGQRVEVGSTRGDVWSALIRDVAEGLVLVVDYDHVQGHRPADGSLTGYRAGRQVAPVPDGRCDLTAHVALDALPAAPAGRLVRQHEALRWLGVDGRRPDPSGAVADPRAYVAALAAASEEAELLDRSGLGGFGCLLVPRGPAAVAALEELPGNGHWGLPAGRVLS